MYHTGTSCIQAAVHTYIYIPGTAAVYTFVPAASSYVYTRKADTRFVYEYTYFICYLRAHYDTRWFNVKKAQTLVPVV